MSRASQISDRQRIAAYFRTLFRAEQGLAPELADRLATRTAVRIKRMVIWDDEADADAASAVSAAPADRAHAANDAPPAQQVADRSFAAPPAAGQPADPAFDPYAFSAVVVLSKSGKDGLMKRLAAIDRPEHLKKLADAQHLALDGSLSTLADLRAANERFFREWMEA